MRSPRNRDRSILTDDPLWYKDAIIYELHVRAFHDHNGDGIGDFRGLLEKMDYLHDLGITALWLLPFYPSPLRDDGYDIADYTDINEIYGSLPEFKAVLREAHRRGIRVITELVINHTSDKHPWFQRSRRAAPGSTWRNYYVWNDTPNKYQEARIVFSDFEPSNWSWDAEAMAFYWHRFYAHQPDLNFDHPAVHKAVFDVLDFWLDLEIDGMRLDAIAYLYEREGTTCENLPETHEFLKKLRKHIDERFRNRMFLAEANEWPEDAAAYFGGGHGDESNMVFHFPLMPRLFMAIRMEDRFPIIDILKQTPPIPETSQWALFLRNHDELTLATVTAEDRDYMYRVYAQDAVARVNLGIRRRLAPLLENHRGKIELMNGLLFSLPGTPVLYYGDEIGMGDNMFLGDRNGVRTPMQWSPERNAGFSQTNPQRLYLPVVIDPEYHYQTINVEAQQNNPHSLLWWMKRLIALRKRHQAFGRGTLEFLYPENHKVLVFVRRFKNEQILVAANLSRFVQCVEVDLSAFKGIVPVEMFGRSKLPAVTDRPYQLTLGPFAFYWLLLEAVPTTRPLTPGEIHLPVLEVTGIWQSIFEGQAVESLERILPAYLQTQPWFVGKGGTPTSARLIENIPIDHGNTWIMLVQVEYVAGEARRFVVPIAFRKQPKGSPAEGMPAESDRIAYLTVKGEPGVEDQTGFLFDALADKRFALSMLDAFARHRRFRGTSGELLARTTSSYHRLRELAGSRPEPTHIKGERSNSTIVFGDRLVLKVFRWVEEGVNPEVEIAQALAEKTTFTQTAPVAGALTYHVANGPPMTWARLAKFIPNEGDAWRYTIEALRRYFEHVLTKRDQRPEPLVPKQPFLDVVQQDLPPMAAEWIGSYLEAARLMGRRTAEMHMALASMVDEPAFQPEAFTLAYQRSTFQTVRNWVYRLGQGLRRRLTELPEDARDDAQLVLGREADIIQHLQAILGRRIVAQRMRCHCDLRLSNLLFTGKDFVIIDFEGEVLRPLGTRRHKRTPLRDVAAWLHSMTFAVQTVLRDEHLRPEDRPIVEPWGRFWQWWASAAFMKAYLDVARAGEFLPRTREDMQVVLDYCLMGRAIYELRHCLFSQPQQIQIPLGALLQLLQDRDRRHAAQPPDIALAPGTNPDVSSA